MLPLFKPFNLPFIYPAKIKIKQELLYLHIYYISLGCIVIQLLCKSDAVACLLNIAKTCNTFYAFKFFDCLL